jgi:hypothetical protein
MLNDERPTRNVWLRVLPVVLCLLLFLALGAYQLHLPGLHYDEAREAGLNAMELLTGQPVTAFRDAAVQIGPWRLPLMVQDYIGALNVILAIPFLAIGGVNVVALRWLPLVIAALTLLVTCRVALRLGRPVAGAATVLLMAVSPSFVFWSRQGLFVTNITALIFMASLLTGLRWWGERRPRDLWLTAFLWGLGVYAKLLFVWAIGAMVVVAALAWLVEARNRKLEAGSSPPRGGSRLPTSSFRQQALAWALAAVFFLIPLAPLILFNISTGGTFTTLFGNLGRSYYGIDNSAYLSNLLVRLRQVVTLLRGENLEYLGGAFANRWAAWAALGLVSLALLVGLLARARERGRRATDEQGNKSQHHPRWTFLLPMALLALIVVQSAFTVSDLFITHYAMLVPLIPLTGGLAFGVVWEQGSKGARERGSGGAGEQGAREQRGVPASQLLRALALIALLVWAGGDLWTTVRYHRALTASGGLGPHSDAIYELAQWLDLGGFTAPVALDWGLDAQIRFLTADRVQPVEVFGYTGLGMPDAGFAERAGKFLANWRTVYLAHVPEYTVFRDRVNALAELAGQRGLTLREQVRFGERDGLPLILVYGARARK